MENEPIKAVIFGATGLAGSGVLHECLKHPAISSVTSVTRRSTGIQHRKLTEIIHGSFLDYSSIENELKGHNACFWCLGVSSAKARDEKTYSEITHDYTIAAAKILAGVNHAIALCFLTGMGTDPTMKSRFMWARVKGKTERDLESIPLAELYIFRPAFIFPLGDIKRYPVTTKILSPIYPMLYKLFPGLVTNTEEFGLAMINAVLSKPDKKVFENRDFRALAK